MCNATTRQRDGALPCVWSYRDSSLEKHWHFPVTLSKSGPDNSKRTPRYTQLAALLADGAAGGVAAVLAVRTRAWQSMIAKDNRNRTTSRQNSARVLAPRKAPRGVQILHSARPFPHRDRLSSKALSFTLPRQPFAARAVSPAKDVFAACPTYLVDLNSVLTAGRFAGGRGGSYQPRLPLLRHRARGPRAGLGPGGCRQNDCLNPSCW